MRSSRGCITCCVNLELLVSPLVYCELGRHVLAISRWSAIRGTFHFYHTIGSGLGGQLYVLQLWHDAPTLDLVDLLREIVGLLILLPLTTTHFFRLHMLHRHCVVLVPLLRGS